LTHTFKLLDWLFREGRSDITQCGFPQRLMREADVRRLRRGVAALLLLVANIRYRLGNRGW